MNIQKSSVTDIDGNKYDTVRIGNQEWMAQNLCVEHYRNGDNIPLVKHTHLYGKNREGACFYYIKPELTYTKNCGKLYNWYAVNDPRGLAPEGWHIPTDEEWTEFIDYLGPESNVGGILKDTRLWHPPNTGATNESGFTAIPGGIFCGIFKDLGEQCYFWTSTEFWNDSKLLVRENSVDPAWYRRLFYNRSSVFRDYHMDKKYGLSVRCVKDKA